MLRDKSVRIVLAPISCQSKGGIEELRTCSPTETGARSSTALTVIERSGFGDDGSANSRHESAQIDIHRCCNTRRAIARAESDRSTQRCHSRRPDRAPIAQRFGSGKRSSSAATDSIAEVTQPSTASVRSRSVSDIARDNRPWESRRRDLFSSSIVRTKVRSRGSLHIDSTTSHLSAASEGPDF